MQANRNGKNRWLCRSVIRRRTSDWQMPERINLQCAQSTIHFELRRKERIYSLSHAINMYRSNLNCEITCSGEPIKIYVHAILQQSIQYSALLDATEYLCKIRWKRRWAPRDRGSAESAILLLLKATHTFLFENSQRLRSTKVASSTNNVKLTISKLNAVTDDAFAATKWQRFRREMEISNAKVCSNNNNTIFLHKVHQRYIAPFRAMTCKFGRPKSVQSGFSPFSEYLCKTFFFGFVFICCFRTATYESREPERYIDPAMIGILVGMAIMFIIICIVLRLFSR